LSREGARRAARALRAPRFDVGRRRSARRAPRRRGGGLGRRSRSVCGRARAHRRRPFRRGRVERQGAARDRNRARRGRLPGRRARARRPGGRADRRPQDAQRRGAGAGAAGGRPPAASRPPGRSRAGAESRQLGQPAPRAGRRLRRRPGLPPRHRHRRKEPGLRGRAADPRVDRRRGDAARCPRLRGRLERPRTRGIGIRAGARPRRPADRARGRHARRHPLPGGRFLRGAPPVRARARLGPRDPPPRSPGPGDPLQQPRGAGARRGRLRRRAGRQRALPANPHGVVRTRAPGDGHQHVVAGRGARGAGGNRQRAGAVPPRAPHPRVRQSRESAGGGHADQPRDRVPERR